MAIEAYRDQVRLLRDVLPLVMEEADFALKGDTAINLFEWDIRSELTEDDRAFLYSFEASDPARDRFPITGLAELPAPQFKLTNIRSLMALEGY
jgi:hypothetical protein